VVRSSEYLRMVVFSKVFLDSILGRKLAEWEAHLNIRKNELRVRTWKCADSSEKYSKKVILYRLKPRRESKGWNFFDIASTSMAHY